MKATAKAHAHLAMFWYMRWCDTGHEYYRMYARSHWVDAFRVPLTYRPGPGALSRAEQDKS